MEAVFPVRYRKTEESKPQEIGNFLPAFISAAYPGRGLVALLLNCIKTGTDTFCQKLLPLFAADFTVQLLNGFYFSVAVFLHILDTLCSSACGGQWWSCKEFLL